MQSKSVTPNLFVRRIFFAFKDNFLTNLQGFGGVAPNIFDNCFRIVLLHFCIAFCYT